jgi:uncharacterized membrane protein YjgN (DUF898 family)
MENLTLKTSAGDVKFQFNGTGGSLFGTLIVGAILTGITFGIYAPWFMVKMTKYFAENTVAVGPDGRQYNPQFNGSGGDLFVTYLVGLILTSITFGIYGAWFMVKLNKYFLENTAILSGGQQVGSLAFNGEGGELLGTFIVGILLTYVTLGIYSFWFQVKLWKYMAQKTTATLEGGNYGFDFVGTGGENFKINIVGLILTSITFGIYGAWLYCNLMRFQFENTAILNRA